MSDFPSHPHSRPSSQKFYTEEGNWDVLCTNFPVFGARDAKIGPDVIHAFKRDPRTAEWFPTQTWDFIDQHPEGLHQALMLYSDRGTPLSYRHQHFYACNTYRCAAALGSRTLEQGHNFPICPITDERSR